MNLLRAKTIREIRPWLGAAARALACLALLCGAASAQSNPPTGAATAPMYTAAGIVNAASNIPGPLAPNGIASLYGSNLSYTTYAIQGSDVNGGSLPLTLQGVTVYVNNLRASLLYVSPGQINFVVPYIITATTASVYVARQGTAGPTVQVQLAPAAPAFFVWNGNLAVAEHADGSVISPGAPAQPNETIVLYAAGLGRTSPDQIEDGIAQGPAQILYLSSLQVLLNGTAIPASSIFYAGVTPGFEGLYQINVQLPGTLGSNPQIQVSAGSQMSPPGIALAAQ